MNRIDRLFGILTLLQSRRYVTAEKIAAKYGISIRTVYRDIRAIGEQGVPVSFEPNKGYFIVAGYFLPPVSFTTEEANALLLMETVAYGFADKSIRRQYSGALGKIKSVLRSGQKETLEQLSGHIRIQVPAGDRHNFEYLSVLQQAIATRHIVELEYTNSSSETTIRQTEPVGLIYYAFHWHLIAWCHLREEYRDFRLSRVSRACDTGLPFRKTDHIALNDYMKQLPVAY